MQSATGEAGHEGLIGRERELTVAERLRSEAGAGRPRILLLRGEAGIGKSHLAQAVAQGAAADGARVLWGSAHEDVSIPYLPLASALAPLLDQDPVARQLLDPSLAGGGGDRPELALWTATADCLLVAARTTPLMLVLDDLQWADTASLDLVLHLLTALTHPAATDPVRLLTVITIRSPVVDDRPARVIDRIARDPGAVDLTLTGLDPSEVRELVLTLAPAPPSARLLRSITDATGGNPLLVRSLVRRALERDQLVVRDRELVNESGDALLAAGHDLDRAMRDRLALVDDRCRDLLTIAAFLGDDRPVAELFLATDDPATAETLIDEAVAAELLEEHGDHYRFAHPQIRQVLYHAPQGRQRWRLHLRAADLLERVGGPGAALAVARHLAQAGPLADPALVYERSRAAATHALAVGAWSDAARAAEAALASLPDDAPWTDRCDLHIAATWAAFHDFDVVAARRHAHLGIDLARDHGDARRWGEVMVPFMRGCLTNARSDETLEQVINELQTFLDEAPAASDEVRTELGALLAEALAYSGDRARARSQIAAVAATISDDTDPYAAYAVADNRGLVALLELDLDQGRPRDSYEEARRIAERMRDEPWRGVAPANRLVLLRHITGDLPGADEDAAARLAHHRRFQLWAEHSMVSATTASIALARGRFGDVERYGREARLLLRRSGYAFTPGLLFPALALGRALRGDLGGAHAAIEEWQQLGGRGTFRYEQAIEALGGNDAAVAAEVRSRAWPAPPEEPGLFDAPVPLLQAEVAAVIGDSEMATAALPGLRYMHERGVRVLPGWAALVSRAAAEAAAAAGDVEEATHWLALAEQEARRGDLRPEAARILLLRARVEATSSRRAALAAEAAERLDELGLLPLAAAARRLASGSPAITTTSAPAMRAIIFTDLVDSTALNVRVGDEAWLALMHEHDSVLRARLRDHDGVEFKHTGDGVAAWFASATDAIECVVNMSSDLERANASHPDVPLRIRAGVAVGEPVGAGPDLFGLAVVRAARVCALAGAGQVLVASEAAALARRDPRLDLTFAAKETLKGFPEPVDLFEATLSRTAVESVR